MTKVCASCGREFDAKRAAAKYCGDTCRQRAKRSPSPEPVRSLDDLADKLSGGLVQQVRSDLEAAGVLHTTAGQQAILLARRIGSPMETAAGVASCSKRLSEVMAEAMSGAKRAVDPLDELKAIRDRKRHTG
jgi:hypothetical protein